MQVNNNDAPEKFFRLLEVLHAREAVLTRRGGFKEIPGVQRPPEQVILTAKAATGESLTLMTIYEGDENTDPDGIFRELAEIIAFDGLRYGPAELTEIRLLHTSPAFSDAIRLIGLKKIMDSLVERAVLRAACARMFLERGLLEPEDTTWGDAALRMKAPAYLAFSEFLEAINKV